MGDACYSFGIDSHLIFQLPKNSVSTIQFIQIIFSLKSSNNRNVGNGVSNGSDHRSHLLMSRLTDGGGVPGAREKGHPGIVPLSS